MTAILVTAAMLLDLLTADVSQERSPLAAAILASGFGFAAKAAEVALILAVVVLVRRTRPGLAVAVAGLAVIVGGLGALSNVRWLG